MTPLETIVETRLGLSPEAIGPEVLGRAATRRMIATSAADPDAYATLVEAEPDEWEELLEELVVPETWFFRTGHRQNCSRRGHVGKEKERRAVPGKCQ